jgi:hypothetical protein
MSTDTKTNTYVLLSKEYSCEELNDVERNVSEALEFPKDKAFLIVKRDEHGFSSGTYKLLFVYEEDA